MTLSTRIICTYSIKGYSLRQDLSFSTFEELEQDIAKLDCSEPQVVSVVLKKQFFDKDETKKQNDFEAILGISSFPTTLKEEVLETATFTIVDKLLYPSYAKKIAKKYGISFNIKAKNLKPNVPIKSLCVHQYTQPGLVVNGFQTAQTFSDIDCKQATPEDTLVNKKFEYLYGKKCDMRQIITNMLAKQTKNDKQK